MHTIKKQPTIDIIFPQMGNDFAPTAAVFWREYQAVHPVDGFAARRVLLQQYSGNGGKTLTVKAAMRLTQSFVNIGAFGLSQAYGRMKIAHTVVVADIRVQICARRIQRETHVLEIAAGVSQVGVICDYHASFAGGNIFVGKKAETCNAR